MNRKSSCVCAFFLILNYETYWESFNCVTSIEECVGKECLFNNTCQIVIVDNGSSNDSVEEIEKKYSGVPYIHILKNKINFGFAKGNNVGFDYIKYNLCAQFICMINSDILMTDKEFLNKLCVAYERLHFDVAGPRVVLSNGECLNPQRSTLVNVEAADKAIRDLTLRLKMCNLRLELLYAALLRLHKKMFKRKNITYGDDQTRKLDSFDGEQIHGCFIIFSENYIKKFDGLISETFLYYEEDLLRLRCQRSKMSMWYLSDIGALHNESRTEKFIGGKINDRHRKRYSNMIDSVNIVRAYLLDEEAQ